MVAITGRTAVKTPLKDTGDPVLDTTLSVEALNALEPTDTDAFSSSPDVKDPADIEVPPVPFWQRGRDWLIEYRHSLSDDLNGMATAIDHFFAGNEALERENKSYARLRLETELFEGEGLSFEPDLKFRLSLPATKLRYRVIIESDDEDADALAAENPETDRDNKSLSDTSRVSASLQFIDHELGKWRTKARAGLRGGLPLNPFIRHTATRIWNIDDLWRATFEQRLGYYREEKLLAEHSVVFERRLQEAVLYRSRTVWGWRESEDKLKAAQVFTLFNRVSDTQGIEYKLSFLGSSGHHLVLDDTYFTIHYRQLLYQDWLFMDVIPGLQWSREEDFEPRASIRFRLEILFFK